MAEISVTTTAKEDGWAFGVQVAESNGQTRHSVTLSQQDFESLRRIAHGMKGVGGSYGFDDLTTMAATIEQAAKVGDPAAVTQTLGAMAAYLESVEVVYD